MAISFAMRRLLMMSAAAKQNERKPPPDTIVQNGITYRLLISGRSFGDILMNKRTDGEPIYGRVS